VLAANLGRMRMNQGFSEPLFRAGGQTFDWRDVILCAHLEGRWEPALEAIAEGLAGLAATDADEDADLEEAVDSAAAEFRYERELITAEETEAWLAARGVTVADWLASVRRGVLRERLEGLGERRQAFPPSRKALERAVMVDLRCTSLGQELAESCASQVAGALAVGLPSAADPPADPVDSLPAGLDPQHAAARRPLFEAVRHAVQRYHTSILRDDTLRRAIQGHQVEWVRMECRTVTFAEEPQAREAALCLREDGQDLATVAAEAGLEPEVEGFFIEELTPELQPLFLSARPGDVVGPVPLDQGQALYLVAAKTIPALTDPEVRARAAAWVSARALAGESASRIEWVVRW
jgi:hypothetical protein